MKTDEFSDAAVENHYLDLFEQIYGYDYFDPDGGFQDDEDPDLDGRVKESEREEY